VHLTIGKVWLIGIAKAASMEDDYLPLYEVVDQDKNDHSDNNIMAKSSGYERLIVNDNDANSVQEEYQLPQSDTRYVKHQACSEIATEIQTLKRKSRHLKMLFSIGGVVVFTTLIITLCIFGTMWVRFGRNLAYVQKSLVEEMENNIMQGDSNTENTEHDQRNLIEWIDHVQSTLTKQIDILSEAYHALGSQGFQNCSQETTTCNFTYYSAYSDSWLYCDTPHLQIHKRVS
jgi:hypothetical protein